MRYYLIQDHRFIDDFVVLLASMVCCARSSVRARVHERARVHASVCTLACPCAHAHARMRTTIIIIIVASRACRHTRSIDF